MKKSIIAAILCLVLFVTFNVWAQSDNSLKFKVGSASVQKGKQGLKMKVPLFKIDGEHFVSMDFLSENLDGIDMNVDEDEVTFGINASDDDSGEDESESGIDEEKITEDLLKLINGHRKDAGAAPVELVAEITGVALAHSEDMCERDFFDHVNPDDKDPGDRLDDAGIKWKKYTENIQKTVESDDLAKSIDQTFQKSSEHRKNRENKNVTQVGIGIKVCGEDIFVTELYILPDEKEEEDPGDEEELKDLKLLSAGHWLVDESPVVILCFKNIGKNNLTNFLFPVSIMDDEEEVDVMLIMYFGILEPGQCYSQSYMLDEGVELSDDAYVSYSFNYEVTEDKNPPTTFADVKMEKGTSNLKIKGKATNKSKEDYLLFIFPQFFYKDGDKYSICDVGIAGIEEFKAGKTYSFSGGTIYTPDEIKTVANHFELCFWYTTPEEYAVMKSWMDKKSKASYTAKPWQQKTKFDLK